MIQLINRRIYTERIAPFINKNIIKVLTGQRRVGKSCILRQIQNHIEQTQPDSNIICINKELEEFAFMRSHEELSAYVSEHLKTDKNNYLFIDEVQDIQGFEHTLRSLQAQDACDIYITGSNATMLSSELSTYLSGRYVEFHIHSLSYLEFLEFHKLAASTQSLRLYLTIGGLPYLSNLPLDRDIDFEYLRNVYSTIMLKDVVKRESIRNVDFLESLALYTGQQTGGREIDFVAKKGDEVVYIQSTYMMADESTRQREFGNLQAIRNNYAKYVVSLDEWTSGSSVDGIKHIHLGDFLRL